MAKSTARSSKRCANNGNEGVFHDSYKNANHAARRGTRNRPLRKRRRTARAQPQQQAPAWERLNPLSRKQIRVVAEALALQQTHAQLPEPLRARLSAALQELDRLVNRLRALLVEVTRRTPPGA